MKYQLEESIKNATAKIEKTIGEKIVEVSTEKTKYITDELKSAARNAQSVLEQYKREVINTHWKIIGISFLATIVTCFLIVWFLMPKPTLPLTEQQINNMYAGQLLKLAWPKLTKKEQDHLNVITNQAVHLSLHDLITSDGSDYSENN